MSTKLVRWTLVGALGLVVTLAIIASVGSRTPTLRKLVVQTLADRLDSEVELGAFGVDIFPSVHVTGAGLVIRHRNRHDVPALVSVDSFVIDGGLFGLLTRPRRFRTVTVTGLHINIPPGGFKRNESTEKAAADRQPLPAGTTSTEPEDDGSGPGAIVVDRLVAENAELVLIPRRADKAPKVFHVHHLTMEPLGKGIVMSYKATLTNPLPKGEIDTVGTFGPWQREDPGGTPLTGRYTFDADLSTVKGIGGHLTSTGKFSGQLDRIDVSGETRTPDFFVKVSGNPLPLNTTFEAVVDGTDGDTYLNAVAGTLLNTSMDVRGAVVGAEGRKGKTVQLHVKIKDGRIEDILRLAVRGDQPLMLGRMALEADMNLPAGPKDVMDRLQVAGNLDVAEARFTDSTVEEKVSNLSERARGLDPKQARQRVASHLRAKFTLARGMLGLQDALFQMPGATMQMAGKYGLFSEMMTFDGTVRMQATISQAAGGGFKGVLLKAIDPIFRKKGAGAVLPIRIRGTRKEPHVGLDVKRVFGKKG
jgi:AsmA-like C-terminal region